MNLFFYLKQSFSEFSNDRVTMLAAALSYYTVFSIGPLLLIVISILGFFFGSTAVEGEIIRQISGLLGTEAALTIESIIEGTQNTSSGIISLIIGVLLLVLGATGVFGQLKTALNQIWHIEPKPGRGVINLLRERILSFGMVVVIAFLLGVSLVASSAISILGNYFTQILPAPAWMIEGINIFISFWIILVLFALVYRVLPDVKPSWKLVWGGATVASLLFTIGRSIIGIYIGNSAVASTYGAASSLVIILLWVYYSSLILLFGAEYVKVSAAEKGIGVPVEDYAYKTREVKVEDSPESEEFSEIEREIISIFGNIFKAIVLSIDSRFIHKKKSFWERVQEKLKED